jgi:hypothetical protein
MTHYSTTLRRWMAGLLLAGSLPAAHAAHAGRPAPVRVAPLAVRITGTITDEQNQPVPGAV